MEISTFKGVPDMGMGDPGFIHQWQMASFEDLCTPPIAFGDTFQHSFTHPCFNPNPKTSIDTTFHAGFERPMKQLKTDNSWNSSRTDHVSNLQSGSPPSLLSFACSSHTNQAGTVKPKDEAVSPHSLTFPSDVLRPQDYSGNHNYGYKPSQRLSPATAARLSQTKDHIMAERKRREKLSQRFIALSAIVPGLKKMDKASVLADAIKYMKNLQEQVKELEEQAKKKTMESVVFVKKTQFMGEGENSFSDESFSGSPTDESLPEVEVRLSNKDVLVRIHCEKKKGVTQKILAEIEKLHLTVINSSVMAFGSSALDVTVIAQMDMEFSMTVKDLVKTLHKAFKLFM